MSVLYGALVGYIYRIALRWAEEHKYVDRESFLIFAITIAVCYSALVILTWSESLTNFAQLFIVGTLGMLGSDDVSACFVAGNIFTWE